MIGRLYPSREFRESTRMNAPPTLKIIPDDPRSAAASKLLAFHLAEMARWSPPEQVHALPAEGLSAPDIAFCTAWRGDTLAGCGALRELTPDHGELKSMRVAPAHLRSGVGEAILLHLLGEARTRGLSRVSLETGRPEPFLPARRLYEKHGFAECPPFGDYAATDFSLCMTRSL